MSKSIPDMDSKELGALVLHDPARTEEPYSRRSQVASAVLVPNHGHWVGYFDPDDMDRQPLYVRAVSGLHRQEGMAQRREPAWAR